MLEEALQHWQDWGLEEKPALLQTFETGKSHFTGLISVGFERHVLKVFKHSAHKAMNAQTWAADLGMAPKVIFQNDHIGLMKYIEPSQLTPPLGALAKQLALLHSQPHSFFEPVSLAPALNDYVDRLPDDIRTLHRRYLPAINEFLNSSASVCVCHNDLVNENCLATNNGLVFIDWEYSGLQSPWFDLGAVILYQQFSPQQITDFLIAYGDRHTRFDDRIVFSSQLTVLWTDLLWHLDQFGIDYQSTHSHRFEQLENLRQRLSPT